MRSKSSRRGGAAQLLQFDVRDRLACRSALEADIAENGAYYGIVCNAGVTRTTRFRRSPAKTGISCWKPASTDGAYYGIVCNAGVTRDNAFPALSGEDWDIVLETGLDGFFNVVQPLTMPLVRAKAGGRIVTIASVSGVTGNRGQVNYSAAKAA